MGNLSRWTLALLGARLIAACGDDSSQELTILDPSSEHLGRTYQEWAAEWVKYTNKTSPKDECRDPIDDPTGEFCNLFQDPESGVYFLNGTWGGPARRKCRIPAETALFFPLVNVWGDNAGIPAEEVLGDEELRAFIHQSAESILPESLYVRVDGQSFTGLERAIFAQAAPYTVDIPKEPNSYTCAGVSGVEGKFDGYVDGAFAMLAPLSKGEHVLEFGGKSEAAGSGTEAVVVDVTYVLTIE